MYPTKCGPLSDRFSNIPIPCPSSAIATDSHDDINLLYIVPMRQLRLPSRLDGSCREMTRKKENCSLAAENDLQAIDAWLATFPNANTRYIYSLHIEKILLWCLAQLNKALSDITARDVDAFEAFLVDPIPHEVWLPSRTAGASERWSPFRKAGTRITRDFTLTVTAQMFAYWCGARYIGTNPFSDSAWGMRVQDATRPIRSRVRDACVTAREWACIWKAACAGGRVAEKVILGLVYFASLKPAELAEIQMKSFRRATYTARPSGIWSVLIESRSQQRKQVFLIPMLVDDLAAALGVPLSRLHSFTEMNGDAYLVDLLNGQRRRVASTIPPKATQLASRSKAVFLEAGRLAGGLDHIAVERLQVATLSWLMDAYQLHMHEAGIEQVVLWRFIGAWKQIPAALRGYMPDRTTMTLEVLQRHIEILLAVAMSPTVTDDGPDPSPR